MKEADSRRNPPRGQTAGPAASFRVEKAEGRGQKAEVEHGFATSRAARSRMNRLLGQRPAPIHVRKHAAHGTPGLHFCLLPSALCLSALCLLPYDIAVTTGAS